ncbi:MAG TPA: zf-HC2 domain-containing protein [Phycisphaerae bacterium]|nr:zf-HC2 domain-containing protein [Phycisphaerae bacterium]
MNADANNEIGELLSAYLDGEVTEAERARVEQLLASDAEARALYAALQEMAGAVRNLPTAQAPAEVLSTVTTRLERETLLAGADPEVTLARHRRPPVRATLAIAALLAVVIGGGLYVSLQLSEAPRHETQLAAKDASPEPAAPFAEPTELRTQSKMRTRSLEAAGKKQTPSRKSITDGEHRLEATAPQTERKLTAPAARESATDRDEADAFARATRDALSDLGISTSTPEFNSDATAPDAPDAEEALAALAEERPSRPDGDALAAGVGAPASPQQDAAARAPLAPAVVGDRTFEQRLAAGESWPALEAHPFGSEPVRLVVRFRAPASAERFNRRVEQMLAARHVPPVGELAGQPTAETAFKRPSLVTRAAEAAVPPDHRLLYLPGEAGVNYPAVANERQMLARIPATWLDDLIDETAATDAESIELHLGGITAHGPREARDLAGEVSSPAPLPPPPPPAESSAKESSGWLALFQSLVKGLPASPPAAAAESADRGRASGMRARGGRAGAPEGTVATASTDGFSQEMAWRATAPSMADDSTDKENARVADLSTAGIAEAPAAESQYSALRPSSARDVITVVIELDVESGPRDQTTNGP